MEANKDTQAQNVQLENISIAEYLKLLRSGLVTEQVKAIEKALSEAIGSTDTFFDMALFQLQKDLLLFQCRYATAFLARDSDLMRRWLDKIEDLKKEIDRKTTNKESDSGKKKSPYKNFLNWILAVEKFVGFSIDKNNDLAYLVEATSQMLAHFEAQKKQAEAQNRK
jgi:hypothetical protein